jgi:tetratricopeptide (TPR) repeat protein
VGFRLQRSIRLGKFLRLNISKSGIGLSAGVPGLRLSTGPSGTHFNIGLPGTGLSYRKKLGSKTLSDITQQIEHPEAQGRSVQLPELPSPGFFAPRHEKALHRALEAYRAGRNDEALEYFLEAAPEEPGAAIFAAALLAEQDKTDYKAVELLENLVQSDGEFPTPLMEKYLAGAMVDIEITPNVTVSVPVDGLAATLLLVELYQAQRRVREAIALLEEVEELAQEPVLTLSLCELYASRELWDGIIERAKTTEPVDDVTLEILIYYARAMQEKGMHEAAVAVLTKALRRTKDRNPALLNEARYWRAISYLEQGKQSQANKEFQRLYAEDPDFRDVAARLEAFRLR